MNGNGYQKPKRLPKLAMTDIVHGWWPGVGTHCAHCAGRLWLNPPTLGVPGSIACLLCDRETHTVLERVYEMPDFSGYAPKLGRPPVARAESPRRRFPVRPCVECGVPRHVPSDRPRCRACYLKSGPLERTLAVLRATDRRITSREIAAEVGTTMDAVRKLIAGARKRGIGIDYTYRGYRLVGEMAS